MSSIYGYLSSETIKDSKGLHIWNKLYGTQGSDSVSLQNAFLGCNLYFPHSSESPIIQKSGSYIGVFDCLLYNRAELLKVTGAPNSVSDEQLLFNIYLQNGIKGLRTVNGDFTGAVYNTDSQTLTIFRDHAGIRPLFYYFDQKRFIFSTDIRGIVSMEELDVSVSEEWAYKTLAGNIATDATHTEFNNVYRVSPAQAVTVSIKSDEISVKKEQYWRPAEKKIRLAFPSKYQETLRELITDSIKLRLDRFPGTIGAELSGGLDSGVIDIIINRLGRDGIYLSWSDSPEDRPITDNNDERIIINAICDQEHISCNYTDYKSPDYLGDLKTVSTDNHFDNGSCSFATLKYTLPPNINALPLAEASRFFRTNGVSVIFSGHGGDEGVSHRCSAFELFHYHEYYHYLRYQWSTTHGKKHRIIKTLKECKKNIHFGKNVFLKPFKTPLAAEELIAPSLKEKGVTYTLPISYFHFDPVKYLDQGATLIRPENAALLSAYSNVRYVFPFLDYRVLDFAVSIPRNNFLKNGQNRYIYREAFKDIFPKALYKLRFKGDVTEPPSKEEWFKSFDSNRKTIISAIDRDFWANILDFDAIDKWSHMECPETQEERDTADLVFIVLCNLTMAQTCLQGSRKAVKAAEAIQET